MLWMALKFSIEARGGRATSDLGCYNDHQDTFLKSHSYGVIIKTGGALAPRAPPLPTPVV